MQVLAQMQSFPAATTAGPTSGQDAQDSVRAVVAEVGWRDTGQGKEKGLL